MHIIGGKYKKRRLLVPQCKEVRPTTSLLREALFNICQLSIEGAIFLDLFAGSGAMGLEALSRGADRVVFVENNRHALAALYQNIKSLQVEEMCTVWNMDVFKALILIQQKKESFDLIYADPPYEKYASAKLLTFLDQHPLIAPGGSLFIEDSPFEEPPLHALILQRKKEMGRAFLFEYRSHSKESLEL